MTKTPGWEKKSKSKILAELRKAIRDAKNGRYERVKAHITKADAFVEMFNPLV